MASTIKADTLQSTTSNVFVLNSAGTEYARFHTTDGITFSNGGAERVRITNDGNVGIGTTGPSNFGGTNLQVANTNIASVVWTNGTYTGQLLASAASEVTVGSRSNHPLRFATNDTERMRIDSSGNVGIGTSAPTNGKLEVTNSSSTVPTGFFRNTSGAGDSPSLTVQGGANNSGTNFRVLDYDGNADFIVQGTGAVLMGRTTQISSEKFGVEVSGSNQLGYLRSTGTSGDPTLFRIASGVFSGGIGAAGNFIYCEDGGSAKFYVKGNGGIANFSASNTNLSDRREKTNFAPAGEYLSKICNIPVQTFNYIDQNLEDDGDSTLGVVAQDVQEVAPELVTESNWGTEESPKMRLSIYQTDLQYALMKCIQEQQALITQLQADVAALKAK